MRVKTEANVFNPFGEFVQQLGVKPLEDVSAIVEDEMNVFKILYCQAQPKFTITSVS